MMKIFDKGVAVPSHGSKEIAEFIGNASSKTTQFSVAHMLAPPGWSENAHSTQFDEILILITGTLTIITEEGKHFISDGQVGWIAPSQSVAFLNDHEEICEYWAICFPAFSPSLMGFKDF